jgi:hypothetical protein
MWRLFHNAGADEKPDFFLIGPIIMVGVENLQDVRLFEGNKCLKLYNIRSQVSQNIRGVLFCVNI